LEPRNYFNSVIAPSIESFKANETRSNLIAAFNALYHMVDYIAAEICAEPESVRDDIIEKYPNFKIVYSVCLAQKHVIVKSKTGHTGLNAADIKPKSNKVLLVGGKALVVAGSVITMSAPSIVSIDGTRVLLKDLIAEAANYLDQYIDNMATK